MLKEDPKHRPNIFQVVQEACNIRGTTVPIKDVRLPLSNETASATDCLTTDIFKSFKVRRCPKSKAAADLTTSRDATSGSRIVSHGAERGERDDSRYCANAPRQTDRSIAETTCRKAEPIADQRRSIRCTRFVKYESQIRCGG